MPRPYQMAQRQAAGEKTRERILEAARQLLLADNFSVFTMDAVARAADVSRLTVYYQFDSKAKLLEALYDYIARPHMSGLPKVFREGNSVTVLRSFVEVFARFWATQRDVIRRLHGLGAIDAEIGQGLRARNERRRKGLNVILERYEQEHLPRGPVEGPIAVDCLHMLTSFETFDALAVPGRKFEDVLAILQKMADRAIGYVPAFISPHY